MIQSYNRSHGPVCTARQIGLALTNHLKPPQITAFLLYTLRIANKTPFFDIKNTIFLFLAAQNGYLLIVILFFS